MKKWMYVVFPGIMLGVFLIFWASYRKEAEQKEIEHKAELQKKADAEAQKKKEAEERAAADARKRQQEHDQEEADKEAKRLAKQAEDDKRVKDDTDRELARGNQFAKQVADLEVQLDRLRKQKESLTRETFDLARQVELARIAKRNAELEEQRMTDMIAQRAQASRMAQPPPPPPPAKS